MKLATIQTPQGNRAVLFHDGAHIDINATDSTLPSSVKAILEAGDEVLKKVKALGGSAKAVKIAADKIAFASPVVDPNKVVCIGLNYKDHAAESGMPIPKEPVLFSKFPTALTGHDQPILLPQLALKLITKQNWFSLLVKRQNLKAHDAINWLAGYTIGHDVSARDWQLEKDGKQWMAGKTFDTFAPCGPYLVTCDEIPDPHKLGIKLRLNGQTMQDSTTSQLIFSVGEILAYLTQVVTLLPGDLIFTGTPPGVGIARKPPVFLKAGDLCEVEIEGLGILRNPVAMG